MEPLSIPSEFGGRGRSKICFNKNQAKSENSETDFLPISVWSKHGLFIRFLSVGRGEMNAGHKQLIARAKNPSSFVDLNSNIDKNYRLLYVLMQSMINGFVSTIWELVYFLSAPPSIDFWKNDISNDFLTNF